MVSTLKSVLMQSLMDELASLRQREAAATTATERRRWQVLVLLALGKSRREISAATGYSLRTIQQIVQRYRRDGVAGLVDGRQCSPASTLLTDAQQQALRAALQHPPEGGGVWTGPKVAQWMTAATGKQVHRQRGWEYLQRLRSRDVDTRVRSAVPHDRLCKHDSMLKGEER
jgi:transposase